MRGGLWRALLAVVLAAVLAQPGWAAGDGEAAPPGGFREGVHYQRIDPPQPVQGGEGVEVVELLWYGCRTCFILQPALARWRSRHEGEIHYRRMAAITHGGMTLLARAFYAARALGVEEKIHRPLFTAIHRHHRRLEDEAALEEFFAEQGVDPAAFRRALNSRFVARKLRQARIMSRRYGIRGAPTVVVAGRYRVDPSMVHSPEEMIAVLDHLLRLAKEAVPTGM